MQSLKRCVNLSFFYLILGLSLGIFYREFTKFNNFNGATVLKSVHTHTLVLGFIFFIIVLLLEKNFQLSSHKHFNKWLLFYNISLIYVIGTMIFRGILDVLGKGFNGLSHISGLGHFFLGISLVSFILILKKVILVGRNKNKVVVEN